MSLPQPPAPTTCYRHPQREAWRQCTRCGKVACADCLVQAAVGSHCVDCAKAARPDVSTRVKYWKARQLAPVTSVLIGLNLAVFVWIALGGGDAIAFGGNSRTADLGVSKWLLGGTIEFEGRSLPGFEQGEWYRIVTSGFIHYGVIHLAMNMYGLYLLGGVLERRLGSARFGLLYMASLVGGSAGVVLLQPNSAGAHGGASGAVFGLIAALAISLWQQGVSPMNSDIGQLLILNLFITFAGRSFISVGGHLGGAAAGALCGLVMLGKPWKPAPKWATYATPVGVAAAAVLATVVAVTSG
jgi:membrane associated rhomboid family serine protease